MEDIVAYLSKISDKFDLGIRSKVAVAQSRKHPVNLFDIGLQAYNRCGKRVPHLTDFVLLLYGYINGRRV